MANKGFSGKIEHEKQQRAARSYRNGKARNFDSKTAAPKGRSYDRRDEDRKDFSSSRYPNDRRDENRKNFSSSRYPNDRRDENRKDFSSSRYPNDRRDENRKDFSSSRYPQEKAPRTMPAPAMEEQPQVHADELPYFLMGRNPVREALKSGRSVDRILVVKELDGSLREIVGLARDRNVIVREVDRKKLDEMCMPFGHGGKPGNHQGIIALVPDVEYVSVQDILDGAKAAGEAPFVIVLQEISDPHNLGSILRSACCAGAHGVIIPKRRAASVTSAVSKASAGAVEYIKVARVSNIANAMEELKKAGLWIAGADMAGESMGRVDLKGPLALVIGNEGEGLGRLVKERCDYLVRIPMSGPIDSLNAAVAAAVLMFEKRRQDGTEGIHG